MVFNWLMQRSMRKEAKRLAKFTKEKYAESKKRLPEADEVDVITSMVLNSDKLEAMSDKNKKRVRMCCQNVNGFCYMMALDAGIFKGMINLRSLQFTTYMDRKLEEAGFPKQSLEQKREILEAMDLAIKGWEKITGDQL